VNSESQKNVARGRRREREVPFTHLSERLHGIGRAEQEELIDVKLLTTRKPSRRCGLSYFSFDTSETQTVKKCRIKRRQLSGIFYDKKGLRSRAGIRAGSPHSLSTPSAQREKLARSNCTFLEIRSEELTCWRALCRSLSALSQRSWASLCCCASCSRACFRSPSYAMVSSALRKQHASHQRLVFAYRRTASLGRVRTDPNLSAVH
jgi:hypothetical protein